METRTRIADRMAGVTVAAGITVAGLSLVLLGLTFLPVIGIILGLPLLVLAGQFLKDPSVGHGKREREPVLTFDETDPVDQIVRKAA